MTTSIKCVGKRMGGGQGHEHITTLWWVQVTDGKEVGDGGSSSREQMVAYIETNGNNSVWCPDRNPRLTGAWVHVHHNGQTKYIRTVADGRQTDNLLFLPER